jgi:Rieske Fe-S protein
VRVEAGDPSGPDDVLVVGGEDHKVGQSPEHGDPFARLEQWARATFGPLGAVVSQWSGQVQEPTDGLAFIGRAPTKGDDVYVITGDSGMGLTHGTLGARLVADLVLGRANEWAELYDPNRKPLHSLVTFAQENLNTAVQFGQALMPGDTDDVSTIAPGGGAVVRKGLAKLAVFRDEHGQLHTCSAVCPHLKAIVQWNPIERSWDCPAHGSRFTATGELLVGPATDDLKPE